MATDTNKVDAPCIGYEKMAEYWKLIDDLLGGTTAMRAARELWLPKEEGESEEQYANRLARSILFAAFEEAASELTNKPFTRPVTVQGLPADLSYLMNDVDTMGTSLGTFIRDVFCDLIVYGKSHILVDFSRANDLPGDTKADEKAAGVRVIFARISPEDLIGWRKQKNDNVVSLNQIRFKYTEVEPSGTYGDQAVEYIRVWNRDTIEDHQKNEKGDWVSKGSFQHSFNGIPLVTIYANKIGYLIAKPTLMNLAWLNLLHWQSSSEQRRILSMARFAILFGKGFTRKEVDEGITIGPLKGIFTTGDNAQMEYVEHTGAGIGEGWKDLQDLEQKMAQMGHRPYVQNIPDETATGKKVNENRNISQIQMWIRATERGILEAIGLACQWRRIPLPSDCRVNIYSDFQVNLYGDTDKEFLLKCKEEEVLPTKVVIEELQRRGIGDKYTIEELLQMIEDEGQDELTKAAEAIDENGE